MDDLEAERRGIRGVLARLNTHRFKLSALASAVILWGLFSATGNEQAAKDERERVVEIATQIILCEQRPELPFCEGYESVSARDPFTGPAPNPNKPLNQPPADAELQPPAFAENAAATSVPAEENKPNPVIESLKIQVRGLESEISARDAQINSLEADYTRQSDEIESLRSALAAARREVTVAKAATDSAVNDAALAAYQELEAEYADKICFARSDWADYRTNVERVCRSGGPEQQASSDGS